MKTEQSETVKNEELKILYNIPKIGIFHIFLSHKFRTRIKV